LAASWLAGIVGLGLFQCATFLLNGSAAALGQLLPRTGAFGKTNRR
jgi:hypothetical protein